MQTMFCSIVENGIIHVRRTMSYNHAEQKWKNGVPKTKSSIRDILLTQEAIKILQNQKEKCRIIKIIPFEFSDLVFLNKYIGIADKNKKG